jgi:MmeI, DNA-methyltransferase domain
MTAPGLQAVQAVGGVIPPSLLTRIQAGELSDADSLSPASYHLAGRETVRDAASRAWSYLRGAWTAWQEYTAAQPPGGVGTGAARERWLLVLLRELGYGHVPALPGGYVIEDREYPVSHAWQYIPIHLLGPGADLDHRNPGVSGAARAPQAMMQELLNRNDDCLWAILSNGLRLRLLRDSTALAGSAYLEFDLEAIFDGEIYPEFLLMWQLCHVSRLEKRGGTDASPADCWLETWRGEAVEAGARALERLRDGVEKALAALGTGFLRHPGNEPLRSALRDGRLTDQQYHRALLRLVYRLLFCFVAEDRDALLHPEAGPQERERYTRYFSSARLRRLSRVRAGGPHGDLWQAQRLVLRALGNHGYPGLGLPGLAGLFDPDLNVPAIEGTTHRDLLLGCDLTNADLLTAMRHLAWLALSGQHVQPVDYRHLGTEELGSVYESLLELRPLVDLAERTFRLQNVAGSERKTTGSYYTPPGLVSALLDTALDPLLDDAVKNASDQADAEVRLLALSVCDPACGSGHFLVAAARRIAQRLAQMRSGEDEPTPPNVQHALRDVVGRCVYGVDVNDLAAELAKVSLWLEALEPGKPLGFLDARIRVGNSLLSTTPTLLRAGVPDVAFKELEGDDKKIAAGARKRNKAQASGQGVLVFGETSNVSLAAERARVLSLAEDVDEVRGQALEWEAYEESAGYRARKIHADAWCAAFLWPMQSGAPEPPTNGVLRAIADSPSDPLLASTIEEVEHLAASYRFFHWHLEFPEIFEVGSGRAGANGPDGWAGGFSCLAGNPPWERVKLQEPEFFAARAPDIANAPNPAVRRRMIAALRDSDNVGDRALYAEYVAASRHAGGESAILHTSGRYPLAGRGDVNTYAVFAEAFRTLTGPHGRSGMIVPTGIATDATTQYFFKDLVGKGSLAALYDFENRGKRFFASVHASYKFCLLTLSGRAMRETAASFAFFLHDPALIGVSEFSLTPEEITLLNPNTGTCPVFRTRRDAELSLNAARRAKPLRSREGNSYALVIRRLFDIGNPEVAAIVRSGIAGSTDSAIYESKLMHAYDHRFATYDETGDGPTLISLDGKADPSRRVLTRNHISRSQLGVRLSSLWQERWLLVWRNIARSTDERTLISAVIPLVGSDFTLRVGMPQSDPVTSAALLLASFNSIYTDYLLRLRLGGTNVSDYIIEQLPVLPPVQFEVPTTWDQRSKLRDWILLRVNELTYTAWDMQSFARDLGDDSPPFRWDPERRVSLQAELDAAFFHLYGVSREDADYILDTFPIIRRKDEERYGEYRTKRLILEIYDAMQTAIDTGTPYQTILDPPPGQGPRHPEHSGTVA